MKLLLRLVPLFALTASLAGCGPIVGSPCGEPRGSTTCSWDDVLVACYDTWQPVNGESCWCEGGQEVCY